MHCELRSRRPWLSMTNTSRLRRAQAMLPPSRKKRPRRRLKLRLYVTGISFSLAILTVLVLRYLLFALAQSSRRFTEKFMVWWQLISGHWCCHLHFFPYHHFTTCTTSPLEVGGSLWLGGHGVSGLIQQLVDFLCPCVLIDDLLFAGDGR